MSCQTSHTIPFTQIIAFKSHLDNLGKPLNTTLKCIRATPFEFLRGAWNAKNMLGGLRKN